MGQFAAELDKCQPCYFPERITLDPVRTPNFCRHRPNLGRALQQFGAALAWIGHNLPEIDRMSVDVEWNRAELDQIWVSVNFGPPGAGGRLWTDIGRFQPEASPKFGAPSAEFARRRRLDLARLTLAPPPLARPSASAPLIASRSPMLPRFVQILRTPGQLWPNLVKIGKTTAEFLPGVDTCQRDSPNLADMRPHLDRNVHREAPANVHPRGKPLGPGATRVARNKCSQAGFSLALCEDLLSGLQAGRPLGPGPSSQPGSCNALLA